MLSPKAHAFSVDQLLGGVGKQANSVKETHLDTGDKRESAEEVLCSSMGEEPQCHNRCSVQVTDNHGDKVKIELCQADLWQAFHNLGTEMIITKTGRRMFPAIRIRITGLKNSSKYRVSMHFQAVDRHKYRYVYHSSRWMVAGIGDIMKDGQQYEHPDSPMCGDNVTSQVISFEKIKLTNHESPGHGQVSLVSMQKFQPRITIEPVTDTSNKIFVTFPQTAFIAVTAYQNQEITRLKIARNPFAKGFRDAGKCRSSLEVMMASYGVVIESRANNSSSMGKRRSTDYDTSESSGSSPPKHTIWEPHKPTHNIRLPEGMLFVPSIASLASIQAFKQSDSFVKQNMVKTESGDERTVDHRKPESKNNGIPSSPDSLCFPNIEIHPAFRLSQNLTYAYPQKMDPQLIAAYYHGFAAHSAFQNFTYPFPSSNGTVLQNVDTVKSIYNSLDQHSQRETELSNSM